MEISAPMKNKLYLAFIFIFIFIVSCSQGKNDPVLTAIDAAPDHYKVEFENDYVRVIRVKYGSGEKSVMHSHEPFVGVTLTGGESVFKTLDGKSETRVNSPGDVIDGDLTPHSVTSISKLNQESIFVEIKSPYPSKDITVPNAVDVAPDNVIVELEKPSIRIIRSKSPAGKETPMHSHRAGISVALTDMRVATTTPSGEVTEVTRLAGNVIWAEERVHSGKNLGDKPTEMVLFELL